MLLKFPFSPGSRMNPTLPLSHRGSTKTNSEKEALRVEARKRVAAEQGEFSRPKRVPLVREFVKPLEEWLDKTTLAANTKSDYKNGRRLILKNF